MSKVYVVSGNHGLRIGDVVRLGKPRSFWKRLFDRLLRRKQKYHRVIGITKSGFVLADVDKQEAA